MLYAPAIFGESLMDEWMDDLDQDFKEMDRQFNRSFGKKNPLYGKRAKNLMKTDVREHEDSYEVDIELPGFKKDEVKVSLEDGYLEITAHKGLDKDEKEKKSGKVIRQERYTGTMTRSFYVGQDLTEEDIHAELKHGVLKLQIPKKEQKEAVVDHHYIPIAG